MLKIEAGKYYKTRSGCKLFCLGYLPASGDCICCDATARSAGACLTYQSNGEHLGSVHSPIVAEWREPEVVTKELWFYKLSRGTSGYECQQVGVGPCFARKTITITEGEGL